jgi:Ser/Thr protein kinase RdoA (MazF antagonist)
MQVRVRGSAEEPARTEADGPQRSAPGRKDSSPALHPRPSSWHRAEPSEELVDAIRRRFGLGPITRFEDLGGVINLNLRLDTAGGVCVARVRRGWRTPDRVLWQHQVQAHLAACGLPVLRPTASPVTWKGRLVELEPFVAHDIAVATPDRIAGAWEVLGRIHAALEGCTGRRPRRSTYCPPPRLGQSIARTHAVVVGSEARALCRRAAAVVRTKIAPWWRTTAPRLRWGLIHGDFHGRNILFKDDTVAAVLDFDFCAVRPRAFDLGYPIVFSLLGMAGVARMDLPRVAELIAAYDSGATPPLTSEERVAVPRMTAMAALNWLAQAHGEADPDAAVLNERQFVALAEGLVTSWDG